MRTSLNFAIDIFRATRLKREAENLGIKLNGFGHITHEQAGVVEHKRHGDSSFNGLENSLEQVFYLHLQSVPAGSASVN